MKKSIKNIYIIILAVVIMLPVLFFGIFGKYFNSDNNENRTLAQMPELSISSIKDFPTAFENYFDDNLPFKNQLVFINSLMNYKILHISSSDSVIAGKNGWLFYKGAQVNDEDPISDYNGSNLFSDEELSTIAANMVEAKAQLSSRNSDFIIMICPNKEGVYSEYMPSAYGKHTDWGRMRQVVDYLRKNTDLTVVCPYDDIMAYKESNPDEQLYYKYDTHWNNLGSYIGACDLNDALGYSSPDLSTLNKSEGHVPVYDLANLLNLGSYLEDDPALLVENFSSHEAQIETNDTGTEFRGTLASKDGDERKLFVIGDSFSTSMFKYLACNFNDSYLNFYYNYNLSMLEDEQPDVVVYETVERYLNNMLHFSITDGIDAEAEN